MKHKVIDEPVFKTSTLFYCDCDDVQVVKHAKKKFNITLDINELKRLDGTCVTLVHNKTYAAMWVVWVRNYKSWKTMVHEAGHLVFSILDHSGVKAEHGNDETFCYLQGYFVSEFWHVMSKKGK